jgi:peptide-methionine (R)-S-oxide reductase
MGLDEERLTRRGFAGLTVITLLAPLVPVLRVLRHNGRPEGQVGTDVDIVEFTDAGERKGTVRVAMVVKTDDEWKRELSPLAYYVARERGTEAPFSGKYWNLHEKGLFRCVCCGTALFSSKQKFDSGTGWPSFWQPVAEQNVKHGSPSHGYTDSEVTCRRCDAHLGDLFDDGPRPTGLRYCIDSVSLSFVSAG